MHRLEPRLGRNSDFARRRLKVRCRTDRYPDIVVQGVLKHIDLCALPGRTVVAGHSPHSGRSHAGPVAALLDHAEILQPVEDHSPGFPDRSRTAVVMVARRSLAD